MTEETPDLSPLQILRRGIDEADSQLLAALQIFRETPQEEEIQRLLAEFADRFAQLFPGCPAQETRDKATSLAATMHAIFPDSVRKETLGALLERFRHCAEVRKHKTATQDGGREAKVAAHWNACIRDTVIDPRAAENLRGAILETSRAMQELQARAFEERKRT